MSQPEHPPRKLTRVTQALYKQPWAITPEGLEVVTEIVDRHVSGNLTQEMKEVQPRPRGKMLTRGNIAYVPVQGPLMRKANLFTRMSGMSSYESIRQDLIAAAEDRKIRCIVLDVDSPGGEVTGLADTAKMVAQIAGSGMKLVLAYSDGLMCSAAYWLASQANEIVTSSDATVGSIGVIMALADTSRAERNEGVDLTILRTGEHKAVGVGPVSERQLQPLWQMMQDAFKTFVDAVESGREVKLSDEVLSGRIFVGQQAVDEKLVDRFCTWQQFADTL